MNYHFKLNTMKEVKRYKHITIFDAGESITHKGTNVFVVVSRDGNPIGYINWYNDWVMYVFETEPNTIWSSSCLNDVKQFMDLQNKLL